MRTLILPIAALAANLVACSEATDRPLGPDGAPGPSIDATAPPALDDFLASAAGSVCAALYRCCDEQDHVDFFAAFRGSELLAAFHDRLPPAVTLDEPACREVVAEMFAIVPFGDWLAAAERGDVAFDAAGLQACLATLDAAACGGPVRAALYDGTCLGFAPPAGGTEQRRMFERTALPGEPCAPLRDGVGAAFFGTCDPEQAFCCYVNPDDPELGCTYPFDAEGAPRAGTCAAAVADGQACSQTPPLALCRTGSSCDPTTLRCVPENREPLAVGELCVDEGFNLLGECVGGFCDLLGTSRCEALRADGAACSAPYECVGGACTDQRCAPASSCDGVDAPALDAGVEIDAPVTPDAGSSVDAAAADGEACATAFDLLTAASPSSLPGFDLTVGGGFGATNDYNPLQSATPMLPPACSVVYDASGQEVVYAVTLHPGDRLVMRYAVTPTSVPGAIYLLDACGAEVDWPDHDGSGACGNNEYRSQGFCGVLGCDPIAWSFLYPTTLGGAPTATQTFWLVLDHLPGAVTSYQLDVRIE